MMRFEDWPALMEQALAAHRNTAFEWGVSDCGIMFADVVLAMTGGDPLHDIRRCYANERGAIRALRLAGYESVFELVTDRFAQIPVAQLGRGDLVFPERNDRLSSPAIVTGSLAISKNQRGLVQVSRNFFKTGFQVI